MRTSRAARRLARLHPGRPDPTHSVSGGPAAVLAAVLLLLVGAAACGSDYGSQDDMGGANEAEPPVSESDDGEGGSLGEVRERVEQRATEAGLPGDEVRCVLDYLEETFDDSLSGDQASVAIDEAFGACSAEPAPEVPLVPGEQPDGR